jgi:two-component system cell cycle response regulator
VFILHNTYHPSINTHYGVHLGRSSDAEAASTCPLNNTQCTVDKKIERLRLEIDSLKAQVNIDSLTGLFNARHLRFVLEQELERTQRTRQPTAFIMLDVDHFKQVNDQHGHLIGDHVLQHLASLVRLAVRKIDIPCRYGGEEFAVILPSTSLIEAIQVAERIRQKIAQSEFTEGDTHLSISVSAGVDIFTQKSQGDIDSIIARADEQLYLAKSKGRNCVSHNAEYLANKNAVTRDEKQALFDALHKQDR